MNGRLLKIKHFAKCYQITYAYRILKKEKSPIRTIKNDKEESLRCSLSRACSKIKDFVLTNEFEFFFTLTIKDEFRNDIEKSVKYINDNIKKYAKNCTRRGIEFKYIYVFELQKKGGVHLHGFFSGFYDLYLNKYNHISSKFFDNIGFQNFAEVDNVNPFYMIKYVNKENVVDVKHKYYRSRNLVLPEIDIFHDNLNEFQDFIFTFENNYYKMVTIAK